MQILLYLFAPIFIGFILYYIELVRKNKITRHNFVYPFICGVVISIIFFSAAATGTGRGLFVSFLLSGLITSVWTISVLYRAFNKQDKTNSTTYPLLVNASTKIFITFCIFLMVGVIVDNNVDSVKEIVAISIGGLATFVTWIIKMKQDV